MTLEPALRPLVDALTDTQLFAVTLYGEARSEPIEGIVAVASVIRNRMGTRDVKSVCLEPDRFACWSPAAGKKNHDRLVSLVTHLANKQEATDPKARQCIGVATCVLQGYFSDNTDGATDFHKAAIVPRPAWARDRLPLKQRGSNVFYKR